MIDTKESCFAVEDSIDGEYFALEFEEVGERAQEHLQSVWQRLNLALDSHAKKEELAAPNWLSWSPWKWTTDKREAYANRQKYVGWCGSQLAGILNVWPNFTPDVPGNTGATGLYIEHVACSPGNLTTSLWARRYNSVGTAMFAFAVFLSREQGFQGRVSLHAVDAAAVRFYRRIEEKLGGGLFQTERQGIIGPTPHGNESDRNRVFFETTVLGAEKLLQVYHA